MSNQRMLLTVGAVTMVAGVIIGAIIGHFATSSTSATLPNKNSLTSQESEELELMSQLRRDRWQEGGKEMTRRINDMVSTDNLRDNLKELTRRPHLAGTARDDELAEMVRDRFTEAGFDTADLVPYRVLLSRPNATNPNLISLNSGQNVEWESHYKEKELHQDDYDEDFVHAFNAYSPAGTVTTTPGEGVIYVNYARVEDYEELDKMGVNISGHIVICRYGKIYRGNKIQNSERWGATGVIIFSDPKDVAVEGQTPQEIYPNTWWLPGSGMQRGTTYMGDGDPLTPGWPSTENAYRISKEEADLPKIPCQPIGYDDAKVILEKLEGPAAPSDWIGGIENVAYTLGPEWKPEYSTWTLTLSTHNTENIYRSYNVIGTIKGEVEPDRYIILGNHRDAWGYGASDPSSGTAQMLESARVFGELMKEGWRPRRTIVFCNWGAEEYGLLGSQEWVEEHTNKLQARGVAYVNVDTCASGPIFRGRSSPILWDILEEMTKVVPGTKGQDNLSLHDEWSAYTKWKSGVDSIPLATLGAGSDHAPFAFFAGVPSMDYAFKVDSHKWNISTYPAYHTGYETFYMVDKHIDPGFKIHQGCSRLALHILRYLADSSMLPYSIEQMPKTMAKALKDLKIEGIDSKLINIYDKYVLLEEAVDNFTVEAINFEKSLQDISPNISPVTLRAINDQMMQLEQIFIMPSGLPGRPMTRHAVFAPSQFDTYAAAAFPGISDLLYLIDELSGKDLTKRQNEIRRHISDLTIMTQNARKLLKEMHII
ncbi:unnamed protein product [Meganyctiphanes norvegica]|uniref:Uncharacterized protein n=1 Tax=Meganyctiphanes norvegica TaxID=48144 RepID=A0AAV2QFU1_MEGNR